MADPFPALRALPHSRLADLFADPSRVERFSLELEGLRFDLSKTHLDAAALPILAELAQARDLAGARTRLFAGEVVNASEGRAALHPAERGSGSEQAVANAEALRARTRALVDAVEADALGPIRHVLHVGIGGSALGPALLLDALGRDSDRYDVKVVSNVDGAALAEATRDMDPQTTLLCIASKTFTTAETMLNARSALAWMEEGGVEDPNGQVVAMTADPGAAVAWGVDETRVLPFAPEVGGRYSLWSSIGFSAALALGWDAWEALLAGAEAMDVHFQAEPWERNAPVLAAFMDLFYAQAQGAQTRAVIAYDERLRLLPSYLQQLEMESNGKSVAADGLPLTHATAPITWGGTGTDAQHAVFQLLHQGTHFVPVEFLAVAEAGHNLDEEHHRQLLINCFAQGAALMAGRTSADGARAYPGDRPSMTILADKLDARTLGALLAFYEHRTYANAVLLGINPFDQFGVELGKEIAKGLHAEKQARFDPSTEKLIARAFG